MHISTGSHCLQEYASPGLSQSSNLNTVEDNDDDNDYMFANINDIPLAHETNESFHVRNLYGYLKPYFSQMIDFLEGHTTMEELVGVKNMIMKITNRERQEIQEQRCSRSNRVENDPCSPASNNRAKYASSNVVGETRTKTYGTKHDGIPLAHESQESKMCRILIDISNHIFRR